MNRKLSLALLLGSSLLSLAQADPPAPAAKVIVVRRCALEYRFATLLGVSVQGIVQDLQVNLGDRVKAGQLLGRLQDLEQQASVKVAQANLNLSTTRVETTASLVRTKAISKDEEDILIGRREADRMLLEAAHAAVRVREIVSPHDGVVVGVYKRKGESVNYSNDPVVRVVDPRWLRVTGYLDVTDAWRVHPGQTVLVQAEFAGQDMPIKREVFPGQVVFVDSEIDPKTRTCKVVAEVANRDNLLRSGLEALMKIDLENRTPNK